MALKERIRYTRSHTIRHTYEAYKESRDVSEEFFERTDEVLSEGAKKASKGAKKAAKYSIRCLYNPAVLIHDITILPGGHILKGAKVSSAFLKDGLVYCFVKIPVDLCGRTIIRSFLAKIS